MFISLAAGDNGLYSASLLEHRYSDRQFNGQSLEKKVRSDDYVQIHNNNELALFINSL